MQLCLLVQAVAKKNDDDDLLNGITTNDLVGDWHFQSLEFEGKVYETDDDFTELLDNYKFFWISFSDVTTNGLGLSYRNKNGSGMYYGPYTLSRNTIFFQDVFEFHIENWETFDGSVLIVKLLKSTKFSDAPVGGIYTMTREDPNDIPDDSQDNVTVDDLVGNWYFQSVEFEGKVYETEDDLVELFENYNYVRINFIDMSTSRMGLHNEHVTMPNTIRSVYTLSDNIINFNRDDFEFYIENWETFDGSTLIVKLISTIFSNAPIGAVYTLLKEESD